MAAVLQLVEIHDPVTSKKADAARRDVAMAAANIWPRRSSVSRLEVVRVHAIRSDSEDGDIFTQLDF